jgi:aminoglycoside phosphotransferase (APT) family kinase protein
MRDARPTAELAASAAKRALGWAPSVVHRFPTGSGHYVFDVRSAGGNAVVVRMGRPEQRDEMQRGLRLLKRLRALGVPAPNVVAEGLEQPCPWVLMERLPGTDLQYVIGSLSDAQLSAIATEVAQAQQAASRFGSVGRFGYASDAEAAPHATWSAVLEENLNRSRRRIASARLFDPHVVEAVVDLLKNHRSELDGFQAVPFLHDTTTKNVIVTEQGVLSGIVDLDDLCFGDPRYAPALTLAVLLAYGGPASYVEAWMSAAGHVDDRIFRLYVALFLVDLMSEHGQSFNGNERASTPEEREAVMLAFTQAVMCE